MKKIASLICGLIFMHVLFSFFMSNYMSYLYQDRVPNVRHVDFDRELVPNLLMSHMIDRTDENKEQVLFVGSSFSWAYPFPKKSSYPYLVQKELPGRNVINLSVIGDNPLYTFETLCLLNKYKLKVDTLVVEINLANFSAINEGSLKKGRARRCLAYKKFDFLLDSIFPYSSFFLSSPFGLNHFGIVHDKFDYTRKRDRKFRFNSLRDGYFNTPSEAEKTFEAKSKVIQMLLNTAKNVSDEVIFFIAPISSYGVALSQYDIDNLKIQSNKIIRECKAIGGVKCLDIDFDLDKKYFMNITHLNMKGHEAFSRYMLNYLD
ncbi:hypothetical protein BCU54_018325 [Vibrio lentus]|nr:hypothetical protein [Vibrio lentus]PMH96413.1 hypothetical protein BCU54_08195 [Vibrio lentus]